MSVMQQIRRRKAVKSQYPARLAAALATGLFFTLPVMMPASAYAQNIEKKSGATFNDNVNNIYADKVINDAAVNAFKNFELDKGKIANMHMGTQDNPNAAGSLFNFVDNQVNISGTVNAVKGGSIGGNLYFLSSAGVVVNSSGVVNAGSVHMAAPTKSFYTDIVGNDGVKETAFKQRMGQITDGELPINPEGTITVSGHINAVDGASLRAGSVNLKSGANIVSRDSLDFSNVVNVSGTSAGLSGNLKLEKSGDASGAINIAAVGDNASQWNVTNIDLKPQVTLENGANVNGDGAVNVSAEAKNTGSMMISNMSATVNVDGQITGDTVSITANTADEFAVARGEEFKQVKNLITSKQIDLPTVGADLLSLIDIDVAVAVHKAEATVNINENAVITATGKDSKDKDGNITRALQIGAESSTEGGIATNPASFIGEILNLAKEHVKWKQGLQNTSVGVGVVKNNATVNVKGKLATTDTDGGVSVRAKAPMAVEAEIENELTDKDNAFLELGVGVISTDNNSAVNLEKNAKLTDIKGDFAANAETENKLKVTVAVKGKDNATVGTSVAVVDHDSTATVKNAATIKAANVSLEAHNNIKKNAIKATNKLGSGQGGSQNTGLLTSAGEYMDNLKEAAVDKIMGGETEKTNPLFENARELFNVGASVVVANEKNTAKVQLTDSSNIAARNDVNVNSAVNTASTKISSSGTAGNAAQHKIDDEHSESRQKAKIQASVVVANIENAADVNMDDGTAAKHGVISGRNVKLTTDNTFKYGNVDEMVKALTEAATAKKLREAGGAVSKDFDALKKAFEAYQKDTGTFGQVTEAATKLLGDIGDVTEGMGEIFSIKKKLMAFVNPSSYGTFSVAPQTIGGKKDSEGKDNSKFAVAGAADLAYLTDDSKISIGKNAAITATGKADFAAGLKRTDTAVNGVLGFMNTGDENSVGGIFSRYRADRTAKVALGQGAAVTAGNIEAAAVKDTSHLSVAAGAGKGGNAGIVAMVSMVGGTDNAQVDVAEKASLTAANAGNVKLKTQDDTTVTNIAGSVGMGTAAGVGASVALTDVERNSLLTLGKATVTGGSADFSALQGGTINSVAIAGGIVANDDGSEVGKFAKFGNWLENQQNKISNVARKLNDKTKKIIPEKLKGAMDVKENKMLKTDNVAKNPQEGQDLPKFSIGAAGSAAINIGDAMTKAAIDGATIRIGKAGGGFTPGNFNVLAKDNSFTGAWGGAAGIAWNNNTGANNENNRSVGVGGAAGWNSGTNTVLASIKNSSVDAHLSNRAEKSGAAVAAGLGLAIAKSGSAAGGTSTSVAASLSVADLENNVTAELENNKLNTAKAASVQNRAYDSDTLVTGGVNASIASGQSRGTALGGSITVNKVTNNVHADIKNGTVNATVLDNTALTKITEVGAGIGVAVSASEGSTYGFEGVAAYNGLKNDARALIDGASVTAEQIYLLASDTNQGSKDYDEYINKRGLDATGASYAANLTDALDSEGQKKLTEGKGNKIIGGALGVSVSTGSSGGSAAAAISIAEIDNDFTAEIKNTSNVKATGTEGISVQAKSGTMALGIGAGVGVPAKSWGGAGSFSWQTTENDVVANVVNNTNILTDKLSVDAASNATEINVAGQVSVGKTAVGLAGTYNELNNTTKAVLSGSTVTANNTAAGTDIALTADNAGSVYAVGAGVTASHDVAAVNGAVAVNLGTNNLEANADKAILQRVKKLKIATSDATDKLAIAGGVTGSKGVAVGGALAFNGIGDQKRQTNNATLSRSSVTSVNDGNIDVTAADKSKLTTAAAGVAFSLGKVSVQGAAAVGLSNKDVTATLVDTATYNLPRQTTVKADTEDKFITTADVVSVGNYAAIGAGVAVTNDNTNTTAQVKGSRTDIHSKNVEVGAASLADITTVGVGGGVNYKIGLGATGSVAVNNIGTKTNAFILDKANVTASDGSVLVNAMSDEKIANYAGALSFSLKGAAIGASVSVNRINSDTEAKVSNATVTGTGKSGLSARDKVEDQEINDSCVDDSTFESQKKLADKRKATEYKGVAITASGTHTLKSFLVNAGVAVTGLALNGTVNVNEVNGSTKALAADGARLLSSQGAASIVAHDYTNTAGLVGTVNFAGQGAGIGLGSDTNKVNRSTQAIFTGRNLSDSYDVDVRDLNIEAAARQGISSLTAGVSGAGIGAGIANSTSVVRMEGTTSAIGRNINANAQNIAINADHKSNVNMTGLVVGIAGQGAGAAIAVGVVKDNDTTEAVAEKVRAVSLKGKADVKAANKQKLRYTEVGAGLAGIGVGGAGSIGVANVESTVKAKVADSNIGSSKNYASGVNVTADNTVDFDQNSGVGSLGGLGGGIGVSVSVNTIDSQVSAQVGNSNIYAQDVNINAKEKRTVEQIAANVGLGGYAAVGANVMVTTVGKELSSTYGDKKNKAEINLDNIYKDVNKSLGKANLTKTAAQGADAGETKNTVTLKTPAKSVVSTEIAGSAIEAKNNIAVSGQADTSVNMKNGSGQAGGGAAVNGVVGVLDVARNVRNEIASSRLKTAGNITLNTRQGGVSKLNAYQGTLGGGGAIGIAYSKANATGDNQISLADSNLTAKNIKVDALDESATEVNSLGVAVSLGVAASAMNGQALSSGKVGVTLAGGNTIKADKNVVISARRVREDENIRKQIDAIVAKGGEISEEDLNRYIDLYEKLDTSTAKVNAKALGAAAGIGGAGLSAIARDTGDVTLVIGGKKNTIQGTEIELSTDNNPNIYAETGALGASLIGSVSSTNGETSLGTKDDHLQTKIAVGDNTAFNASDIIIANRATPVQTTKMRSLSAAIGASVQENEARADAYSDAGMALGKLDIANGSNLVINNYVSPQQNVSAGGVSAAGLLAIGTNKALATTELNTETLLAGTTGNKLGYVMAFANTGHMTEGSADGNGGAIVDISPYAARIERSTKQNTKLKLAGNWQAKNLLLSADTTENETDTLDAIRASVAGGSGIRLYNNLVQEADIDVTGATINTEGKQYYLANNTHTLSQKQKAGGYGGVVGSDSAIDNTIKSTAKVNLGDNSKRDEQVTVTGADIMINALNHGSINANNEVQGAGVVPILIAKNKGNITADEEINTFNAAVTSADGKDVTLAASDELNYDIEANAVNQGSFAGAASSDTGLTLSRTGKVNLAGKTKIASGRDVELFASATDEDTPADLRLILYANAHNASLIPLKTAPKLTDDFSEIRQVNIGKDVVVESLRHADVRADGGKRYLEESAREFRIWGSGEVGTRRLTSTALGQNEVSSKMDNTVDVQGKIYAGIHNQLDIDIDGNLVLKGKTADEAEIDSSGVKVKAKQSWFNPANSVKSVTRVNGYLSRYREVEKAMKEYGTNSAEYKALAAEAQALLETMDKAGFVYKDDKGNKAIITEHPVPALALADINVSGGNVYVDATTFKGQENVTAAGSPHVNITNKGNAMLVLGNVQLSDNGGRLYVNDVLVKDNSGDSAINIKSTGRATNNVFTPDILVQGNIDNSGGRVSLVNNNSDITITGAVNGRSVQIEANQGAINISNPEGLVNVGGDPLSKFQFDEKTAKKIQKKISELAVKGQKVVGFKDYKEYQTWLKNTVGLSDAEIKYAEPEPGAGYVAGGNVAITAKNVNINGLIQSGYSRYANTIKQSDIDQFKQTQNSLMSGVKIGGLLNSNTAEDLKDEDVIGDEKYAVGQKNKVWNEAKQMWDYTVPVYYNPATNHLLTGDIDVKGGRVDIKGAIASTGNGRIVAADGAADISLDTSGVNADLYVGRITNKNREGLIRLNDSNTGMITEYKNGYTRTYNTGTVLGINDGWQASSDNVYKPKSQLYQWTGGTSGQTIKDKYYDKYYASFFGLFKLWSLGSTDELIRQIGSDINSVRTTTRSNTGDDLMSKGVVIKAYDAGKGFPGFAEQALTGNTDDGIYIISDVHNVGSTSRGKLNASSMHYTNWAHTKGYVTYSWTETTGNYISSTSSIAAGRPISIAYGTAPGNISITGKNNIFLTDNIATAASRDESQGMGSIVLKAGGDIQTTQDSRLLTDNLTASGINIDLAHSAIGKEAVINLTANKGYTFQLLTGAQGSYKSNGIYSGISRGIDKHNPLEDITIVSDDSFLTGKGGNIKLVSDKGNLQIQKVTVENAKPTNSILIKAKGDIVNANPEALIAAPAITLSSETGGIGRADSLLRVNAGSTISSSDLNNASLSAEALGNIYIQQVDGDMRVASVRSKAGDVTLEAVKGSIVDAAGGANQISDTAEAIARWQRLGIISSKDGDDQKTAAGSEAKALRLAALDARARQLAARDQGNGIMQVDESKVAAYQAAVKAYSQDAAIQSAKAAYLNAIQNAKDEAAREAALAQYQAAKDNYFKGKGFTAEEASLIADYGDLSSSTNYGWSKNEMLYAIQDSIVNSKPGQLELTNKANISGRNITLRAAKGGIGYDDKAVYIKNADLNKLENLKLLASAKAGDLTWDAAGVTVKRQVPVILDIADGGVVQLAGRDNVYVSATKDSALNLVGGIDTNGDIRLAAGKGVSLADGTRLRGRNLTILGGIGDIGNRNKFLEIMINGWLNANAGGSLYVHQNGRTPLAILSASAGMDAYLRADHGIRMANIYGMDMGYIFAGGRINLYSGAGDMMGVRVKSDFTIAKSAYGKVAIQKLGDGLVIVEDRR